MPSEFDLIRRYFTRPNRHVILGIGDDAALLQPRQGMELVVSTDMLVEGTHFFSNAEPRLLGGKTLAVNLSDMAAMGATPRWATLSAALPKVNSVWIKKFAAGFFEMADGFGVELIGGDTTRGPLTFCVQIMGEVPPRLALRRDTARVGDDVWVSGTVGDAALALAHYHCKIKLDAKSLAFCASRLHAPTPRVTLGKSLRGIAHSAIDISDGLLADLNHILESSGVAAEIELAKVPQSAAMQGYAQTAAAQQARLSGGDDYELCFTAAPESQNKISALARKLNLPLTRIGVIKFGKGLKVINEAGKTMKLPKLGYDHFA